METSNGVVFKNPKMKEMGCLYVEGKSGNLHSRRGGSN